MNCFGVDVNLAKFEYTWPLITNLRLFSILSHILVFFLLKCVICKIESISWDSHDSFILMTILCMNKREWLNYNVIMTKNLKFERRRLAFSLNWSLNKTNSKACTSLTLMNYIKSINVLVCTRTKWLPLYSFLYRCHMNFVTHSTELGNILGKR